MSRMGRLRKSFAARGAVGRPVIANFRSGGCNSLLESGGWRFVVRRLARTLIQPRAAASGVCEQAMSMRCALTIFTASRCLAALVP
jgi:hypothetical protein